MNAGGQSRLIGIGYSLVGFRAWFSPAAAPIGVGHVEGPTRVAWYHHPSDPVGYWSWGLLYDPPEWINDPIGYDVSPRTGWFPIVTFNQMVADLIAGFNAPSGYGHNYSVDVISGWAAVAPPQGWTDADTVRLEEHLHL